MKTEGEVDQRDARVSQADERKSPEMRPEL